MADKTYFTGSNEFRNVVHPEGYRSLSSFAMEPFPTYGYSMDGVQLCKTVFMPQGKNATIIIYDVSNPRQTEALIRISPFTNSRHFHSVTDKDKLTWSFSQKHSEHKSTIQASDSPSTLILFSSDGQYIPSAADWTEEMYFRVDDSRGESCLDDSFKPGHFKLPVTSKER